MFDSSQSFCDLFHADRIQKFSRQLTAAYEKRSTRQKQAVYAPVFHLYFHKQVTAVR